MAAPAMLHLVCGGTGAGKTTRALALQQELGGVRFSIDEWMTTLFADDLDGPPRLDWVMQRVGRCEAQIWSLAKEVARQGVPCILDLGFQRAQHRAHYRASAAEAGLVARLHFIDVGAGERWLRVSRRNAERGPTYRLTVSRQMFDLFEAGFEPPTAAEQRLWENAESVPA